MIADLAGRLRRDTFPRGIKDSDAFLVFVLFHHDQIELSGPVLIESTDELRCFRRHRPENAA